MTTNTALRPGAAVGSRRSWLPIRAWSTSRIAVGLGGVAFLVSFAGSWIPSLWGDEAASVLSAERSLPSLLHMLQSVDAVHGTYYALLHVWIGAFGTSPLSLRFPSAIAVGFATAGTFVLAEKLFSRRVGLLAGLVCVILPRMTFQGAEARSYALSTAAIVWLTVLLVHLVQRRTQHRLAWLGYAAGLALCTYLFLFSALIVVAHGSYLVSSPGSRTVLKRWLQGVGVAVLLAAPVIVVGVLQHHQIAFLAHRTRITPELVLVEQWFGKGWLALACWGLIVVAGTFGWSRWRRARSGVWLSASWLVLPTAILLGGSATVVMMYTNRYLSFCAPAAAIMIALGIDALSRTWVRVAAFVCIIALAAPIWYSQRTEFAKPGGSDWAQVSATMALVATPGDAVVFDQSVKPSWRPRLAMRTYPDGFRGLDDVQLRTPWSQTPGLWDSVYPLASLRSRLTGIPVVWALETTKTDEKRPDSDLNVLRGDGYTMVERILIHRTIIYKFTRSGS
ncbi:MAG: glycosyltransferase family 39 protein [Micrococcales bacterium]|nr:glycosyltransferase family 39 protein [Micrococcales bacterium]